jgi:hypothetical protein
MVPPGYRKYVTAAKQLVEQARIDKIPDDFFISGTDSIAATTIATIRNKLINKWEVFAITAEKKETRIV